MKKFEDDVYEEWLGSVGGTLPGLLKKTILARPSVSVQSVDSLVIGSGTPSRADNLNLSAPGTWLCV